MNKNFTIESMWNIAWQAMDWLLNVLKVLLIVGGAVATSFADIALGTITFTMLLSNTDVFTFAWGKFLPFLLSLASTGIQLILWQIIDKHGNMGKAWKAGFAMKAALVAVVLMKFGDDFVDITSVKVLMLNSTLPALVGAKWFGALENVSYGITEVLAGFSEIFVVNAVRLMQNVTEGERKSHNQPRPQQNRPDFHKKSGYKPQHRPKWDDNQNSELIKRVFSLDDEE